jgi:hypothetical protein
MYCEKCGAKLSDNAKFCAMCGKKVDVNNYEVNDVNNKNSKNSKKPVIIISIVALVVVVGIIVVVTKRNNNTESSGEYYVSDTSGAPDEDINNNDVEDGLNEADEDINNDDIEDGLSEIDEEMEAEDVVEAPELTEAKTLKNVSQYDLCWESGQVAIDSVDYNENGKKYYEKVFQSRYDESKAQDADFYIYEYDENELVTVAYDYASETNLWNTIYYLYDSENRITSVTRYSRTGVVVGSRDYSYYDDGDNSVEIIYKYIHNTDTGVKSLDTTQTNTYDSYGNEISTLSVDNTGVSADRETSTEYTYNNDGTIKTKVYTDSSGTTTEYSYKYNTRGDIVEERQIDGTCVWGTNEYYDTVIRYTYEYDETGNITKCTQTKYTDYIDDELEISGYGMETIYTYY